MVMEVFWELRQERRINTATQDAQRARHKSDRNISELDELTQRVDRLALGCQALWELMREQTQLTDKQVLDRMVEIDLRDGTQDGKMGQQVSTCPECQRPAGSNRVKCLYCGTELAPQNVFG